MNAKEAQAKILTAISDDATRVINRAVAMHPQFAADVRDLERQFPNQEQATGLAAAVIKMTLRGQTNEATAANIIAFAETL
jgi:hypothetical protein